MKHAIKAICIFFLVGMGGSASAQWKSPGTNPYLGPRNPEIQKEAPKLKLSNTGLNGGSIIFNVDTNQLSGVIYQSSNARLALATGVSPAGTSYRHDLTLDSMGFVGLGTNSPTARLTISNGGLDINDPTLPTLRWQVSGENGALARLGNEFLLQTINKNIRLATDTGRVAIETADTTRMVILKNGNVGIGTTSPDAELQVHGDICITGVYYGVSDARLKKDVMGLQDALGTVRKLNPVSYYFRRDEYPDLHLAKNQHIGLLAQEVQKVMPDLVSDSRANVHQSEGSVPMKTVNYVELIPLLIKAIQELEDEIAILKAQNGVILR